MRRFIFLLFVAGLAFQPGLAQEARPSPLTLQWQAQSLQPMPEIQGPLPGEEVSPMAGVALSATRLYWPAQWQENGRPAFGLLVRSLQSGVAEERWSMPAAVRGLAFDAERGELLVRSVDALRFYSESNRQLLRQLPFPRTPSYYDLGLWRGRIYTLQENRLRFYDRESGQQQALSDDLPLAKTQRALSCGNRLYLWSSYSGAKYLPFDPEHATAGPAIAVRLNHRALFKAACWGGSPAALDPRTGIYQRLFAFGDFMIPESDRPLQAAEGAAMRSAPREEMIEITLSVRLERDGGDAMAIALLPPQSSFSQDLIEESLPAGGELRRDEDGNRALFFPMAGLRAGETFQKPIYRARLRRYRVHVDWSRLHTPLDEAQSGLPDADVYLKDLPELQLQDAEILAVRDRLRADGASLEQYAQGAFAEVVRRMVYRSDGRFDPAPVVLRQGHGSCTEFSYATMALLRAAGIPARMAWNYLGTTNDPTFNHKIVEMWHPRLGWIPLEPLAPPHTAPGTTYARHLIFAELRAPRQTWMRGYDRLAILSRDRGRAEVQIHLQGGAAQDEEASIRAPGPGASQRGGGAVVE